MTLIKQQPEPDDDAHGHKNSYLLAFSSRKYIVVLLDVLSDIFYGKSHIFLMIFTTL